MQININSVIILLILIIQFNFNIEIVKRRRCIGLGPHPNHSGFAERVVIKLYYSFFVKLNLDLAAHVFEVYLMPNARVSIDVCRRVI